MGCVLSTTSSPKPSSSSSVAKNDVCSHPVKATTTTQLAEKKQTLPAAEEEEEGAGAGAVVKKEIFVIKQRKRQSLSLGDEPKNTDSQNSSASEAGNGDGGRGVGVRTSSCTKEEVDAILIQCGRLSRSSSGKNSAATKYSGSKRSYDFDGDVVVVEDEEGRTTPSRRQSRAASQERREREHQQRSSSREGGGGRRVSRSPGRRTENPPPITTIAAAAAAATNCNRPGPGKMVSVPASISSAGVDKSSNLDGGNIKRVLVKRNSGGRSRSPANARDPSLSRSSSRKADHSPYRRHPLSEIDPNSLSHKSKHIPPETLKPNTEKINDKVKDVVEEEQAMTTSNVPQTLTRTRSSRRSRDLDFNPETLLNPTPSYTALLLEDIQNFHQKNTTTVSLPACVSKACSIVEAVADLNSCTNSNLSDDNKRNFYDAKKDPIVESEVVVVDDILEPSLHKYVTVRRGRGEDMVEEQESSGSNNVVQWGGASSSSWEPNSGDSTTDYCFTSSSSRERGDPSPASIQRHALSESNGGGAAQKRLNRLGRGKVRGGATTTTAAVAAAST